MKTAPEITIIARIVDGKIVREKLSGDETRRAHEASYQAGLAAGRKAWRDGCEDLEYYFSGSVLMHRSGRIVGGQVLLDTEYEYAKGYDDGVYGV